MSKLDYLDQLENEAIHILREVAGQFDRPALLFSGGKDSICLVHLALKAFRPGKFPFPFPELSFMSLSSLVLSIVLLSLKTIMPFEFGPTIHFCPLLSIVIWLTVRAPLFEFKLNFFQLPSAFFTTN